PNKLYVPSDRLTPQHDFANDQFAVGSSPIMNKYMSTWLNLDNYYMDGFEMIGEQMMRANLYEYGLIGDKLVYMDMNHPFEPDFKFNYNKHSLIREDLLEWSPERK